MCICMIMTLLPAAAFADDAAVVYGKYDASDTWQQDPSATGTVTYSVDGVNSLTLSKTATALGDNTYRIDLKVVSTQTTTTTPPGSAATVLVIDISNSMKYCAECGEDEEHTKSCKYYEKGRFADNDVKTSQNRLTAAKNAAADFVNTYAGDTPNTGRYVSVVLFNYNASVKLGWTDVSVAANKTAALNAISGIGFGDYYDGGTNLEQGLAKAKTQLSDAAVSSIGADAKYVVALTDGAPTRAGTDSNTSKGSAKINKATAATATELKKTAKLYTVCFGASNDKTYDGGPTVGAFLRDSIATKETGKTYAYDAGNTADLMKAFKAITTSITTGIKAGTVTDPMAPNISVTDKPENFVPSDNKTYTWKLEGAEGVTADGKTTYTYTLSYTVKLDTTGEDFNENVYYPTNEKTTLTSGEHTYDFPIPGVKGVIPSYNVSYAYTGKCLPVRPLYLHPLLTSKTPWLMLLPLRRLTAIPSAAGAQMTLPSPTAPSRCPERTSH